MSEHKATILWKRSSADFRYENYNRNHEWIFEGGMRITASAAPAYRGDPALVDPEEAFVASLSSCHMLTFLALASRKGFVMEAYEDHAVGTLAKNDRGKLAVTHVVLQPRIEFSGAKQPTAEELAHLHHESHEQCFIANSVLTTIEVR